jgi:hypothetical protein
VNRHERGSDAFRADSKRVKSEAARGPNQLLQKGRPPTGNIGFGAVPTSSPTPKRLIGDRLQPSEEGVLDDLADHVSNADVHFLNPGRVL